MVQFNLRPLANLGVDRSSVPVITGPAEIVEELHAEIPEITDALQQVRQLWDLSREIKNDLSSRNMVEET